MSSKYTSLYTDEKYLNRRELSRALNTTFVDSFWKEQEEYRKQYRYQLPIYLINRTPLYVTLTPVINDKIAMFENKIDNTLRLYRGLDEDELMLVIDKEIANDNGRKKHRESI